MNSFLSKITASVCLILFLFPQVQKGIHDFSHRNDAHCDARAEQHIHALEHVCAVCDFNISVADFVDVLYVSAQKVKILDLSFIAPHSFFLSDQNNQIELRGPPAIFS